MTKKLVYIAHPISGNIKSNIQNVLAVCRRIHFTESDVIPLAPYVTALQYLDDDISKERQMGFEANHEMFKRGTFDEMWLSGKKISGGMQKEIEWCVDNNIPVKCYDDWLEKQLKEVLAKIDERD